MKKTLNNKLIFTIAFCFVSFGLLFAQASEATNDDLGFSSFTDDAFSADSLSANEDNSASKVAIGGKASTDVRYYVDTIENPDFSDLKDFLVAANPDFKLNVDYSGSSTEINSVLNFSVDSLTNNYQDILDEFTMRLYQGDFIFEAGKSKVVWGKGDKLHVLDNFNANDYSDFVIPDYIDRRLGEVMLRGIWNSPSGAFRAEAVYTPTMTADRFNTSGNWVPDSYNTMVALCTEVQANRLAKALATKDGTIGTAAYQAALANYLSVLNDVNNFSADSIYPNTKSLKYGQAGLRLTGCVSSVDWGVSYYYGHYKTPSVNLSDYITSSFANSGTSYELPTLSYDQLQIFGLEFGGVAGPVNYRGEFAYNLTDDVAGDDPWVKNNSIAWLGGFDVNIPLNNLNFNFQATGSYVLNNDKIGTGEKAGYKKYDVDFNADDEYTKNKLVFNLSDSYFHENLTPEISVIWGIENNECLIMPKISYKIKDDFTATLKAAWIYSEESAGEFYSFNDESFVQVGVSYNF